MTKIQFMHDRSLLSRMRTLTKVSVSRMAYLAAGMSMLIISSCEVEPQITFIVDTPVQEYYERFIYEAAVRGLDVEYATYQVDATISDIPEHNVIGQCSWSEAHQHAITLDRAYWNSANDMQREFVVFHELGHCVLGRAHVDNSDANGNCTSIMTSGTGDCRIVYLQHNRDRMLDELFEE